ncbi:MAG: 3'-5' exonuclease [Bacteroidota bacterium]
MYFIFDIETIPDLELIRETLNEPDLENEALLARAEEEIAYQRSGFLPPMFHRMVSWVGLWIENTGGPRQKVSWNGEEEKAGLQELFDALLTYKDYGLIHHNGRGFDLPLLTYRAMKHRMQMPRRLHSRDIRYRFSSVNIDLKDEFSNYGASNYPKLKHLGQLIGIPFKQTAEGNQVWELYQEGKLAEIEHYCYEDVMATYIVWLQMAFTVGDIQAETFDNLQERALGKLQEIQKGA